MVWLGTEILLSGELHSERVRFPHSQMELLIETGSGITRQSRPHALRRLFPTAAAGFITTGCDGPQSAVNVAGTDAHRIADLFSGMVIGGTVIWLLVIGLAVYATRVRRGEHDPKLATWLIIGGGAVFPTFVLAGLLLYGLSLMPKLRMPPEPELSIAVSGEQWWWRVRYSTPRGQVELANEIRLPVGRRTEFRLSSPDVVHSFWIPSLGGKMDMIPGRETLLTLEPTRTGRFRGTCAEYCGASHAFMSFPVVVMEPEAFEKWLAQQAAEAHSPDNPLARRGRNAFLANGCGACHTVRGTEADGRVGPDLTHVGSRLTLGAGRLPNEAPSFARWIGTTETVKPGVHMPSFGMLPEEEIRAIASYLEQLE